MNPPHTMAQEETTTYWEGWPQHRTNPDFRSGVETVPPNSRACTAEPVQAPVLAMPYFGNSPYAPLTLTTTYAPGPFVGSGCAYERPSTDKFFACPQDGGESQGQKSRTPSVSVKVDPHPSPAPVVVSNIMAVSQMMRKASTASITPPVPADRDGQEQQPENPVDSLLRVIQSKPETATILGEVKGLSIEDKQDEVVKADPADELASGPRSPLTTIDKTPVKVETKDQASKRHQCDFAGCSKTFAQKAQLKTHRRSHTGEKPYPCKFPGCDRSFSQPGNRKTHRRGHTGEAPFKCTICGKGFRQGGNVKPHMMTHTGIKLFVCRLDNCNKPISTKGNLKTHQAKCHRDTLEALARKFSQIRDLASASEADRDMWKYLASVHNNLNKGIKGCRGRRIRRITPSSPELMALPSPMLQYTVFPGHLQALPQFYPMNHAAPSGYGFGHPAPYSRSRQSSSAQDNIHMDIHMYDADIDSTNGKTPGSTAASPTSTATYDDDQEQRFMFRHHVS